MLPTTPSLAVLAWLSFTCRSNRANSPQHVHVILPINRNSFVGCRRRFLQLPFEVEDGDVLAFNLLDDNEPSAEHEQVFLSACESAAFCIDVGRHDLPTRPGGLASANLQLSLQGIGQWSRLDHSRLSFQKLRNWGTLHPIRAPKCAESRESDYVARRRGVFPSVGSGVFSSRCGGHRCQVTFASGRRSSRRCRTG